MLGHKLTYYNTFHDILVEEWGDIVILMSVCDALHRWILLLGAINLPSKTDTCTCSCKNQHQCTPAPSWHHYLFLRKRKMCTHINIQLNNIYWCKIYHIYNSIVKRSICTHTKPPHVQNFIKISQETFTSICQKSWTFN